MKHLASLTLATLAVIAMLTGCQTSAPYHPGIAVDLPLLTIPELPKYKHFELMIPAAPAELVPVVNRAPQEVVNFALALSDAGRHEEAARVFIKAAESFPSRGRSFEQDLTEAAICEFWLAGNLIEVKAQLDQLSMLRQDLYDTYSEDQTVAAIRRIVSQY